jgi:hypothetical protein
VMSEDEEEELQEMLEFIFWFKENKIIKGGQKQWKQT